MRTNLSELVDVSGGDRGMLTGDKAILSGDVE